ncbi:hypothetical protein SCMU_21170 [Sinomonas cyclohexanicum]|uniref:DUF3054 domain-containing protein n=1 Tax=Sinomonas cyclohexanicum TaxID=322009 RepID=A0ABM7PVH9_SINCY|nr:DUF3054 domain-containing protein [Corynebacterium cyclohexanicum]BCT76275.1 hypothetical protein SCMU_21170 [Corynebacterium cyclohexanicum]
MQSSSASPARTAALAAVADLVVVLGFAATGRATHNLDSPVLGVLATAWPFVVGLAAAWAALRLWRRPLSAWPTGVVVWLGTYVIGMLLRWVSGGGMAVPFLLVALGTLGVFLVGWRAVVLGVRAGRRAAADR